MIVRRRLLGILAIALAAFASPEPARTIAAFEGDELALLSGGLLRKTTLPSLLRGAPSWQETADIAALAASEGKDWRLTRAECLPPVYRRCLFHLAESGKPGVALREYDVAERRFVPGGFTLPPGPTQAAWYDDNRIMVAANSGPGTLTAGGAPRLLKLWTRGESVLMADTILAAPFDTVGIEPIFSLTGGGLFHAAEVRGANGERELYHFGWAQNFRRSQLPRASRLLDFFQGRAVAVLGADWTFGGRRYPSGTIVAYPMAPLLGPASRTLPEFAYQPPEGHGVVDARAGRDTLYVHVRGPDGDQLVGLRKGAPDWPAGAIVVPGNGPMRLIAASDLANVALVERSDGRRFIVGRGRARELLP